MGGTFCFNIVFFYFFFIIERFSKQFSYFIYIRQVFYKSV